MIEKFIDFKKTESQLEILRRPSPAKSVLFFKEFSQSIFSFYIFVLFVFSFVEIWLAFPGEQGINQGQQ